MLETIGYKSAVLNDGSNKRVLITLDIPYDAKHNLGRQSVVNPNTAKFRTNKATVIKIEDEQGNIYNEAVTGFYNGNKLIYKLGTEVTSEFDDNIEKVCASGIHFVLDKQVALDYNREYIQEGVVREYFDNGAIECETHYKDGKRHGTHKEWNVDGTLIIQEDYSYGLLHGLSQEWHRNGLLYTKTQFVNGKEHGLFMEWYPSGNLAVHGQYKYNLEDSYWETYYDKQYRNKPIIQTSGHFFKGYRVGLWSTYYDNGKLQSQEYFDNDNPEGLYEEWFENGNLKVRGNYLHGEPHGLWTEWTIEGNIDEQIRYDNGLEVDNNSPRNKKTNVIEPVLVDSFVN